MRSDVEELLFALGKSLEGSPIRLTRRVERTSETQEVINGVADIICENVPTFRSFTLHVIDLAED